ncbi:M23 family metallopeptidase [Aurantibacillus circumpalustris]|uniref:M23 family metallopeptidase n=1 Tax=Aurantibacillus circumpalustris TaxID=3036359 RepID=UPI00295B40B6|nr:M23 family metallopeptidase [Aurantibacillus circumpalustris]
MRISLCSLVVLFFCSSLRAGNDPTLVPDSVKPYRIITKSKLVHLIDSVFDLKEFGPKDFELLNYYASILTTNNSDSVRITKLNLNELSFYSQKDELSLFPAVDLKELPAITNLIVENGYLSYYSPPIEGVVTSHFGWRDGRLHKGIDIDLNRGDKIKAAFSGKVRVAKRQGGFGNVVIIMHPNGLETVYAHLSRLKVKTGDIVLSGQVIGLGGSTGHSSGSHLHLEFRYQGHPLNPGTFISFTENKLIHHSIIIKQSQQSLCAFPSNKILHEIKHGDSWFAVAHKYGLTMKELMALNGVERRFSLKVGQQLRIN